MLLPLSYRLIILINLASLYWNFLVKIWHYSYGINFIRILHLGQEYGTASNLISKSNSFCTKITTINVVSWLSYITIVELHKSPTYVMDILPCVTIIANFYMLFTSTESRFSNTVKRIILGKIDHQKLRLNDILLSDSLTSYSKIILDLANYFNYIIRYNGQNPVKTLDSSGIDLMILAAPQFIRLSQCWREYVHSNKANKQNFYNFLKYLSNVIPLVMIYISRSYTKTSQTPGNAILMLEKIAIGANSIYTFYWDVMVDWKYKLVSTKGLVDRWFKSSVIMDFTLRFIWLSKFVFAKTGFYYFNDTDPTIVLFIMQFLEVTRRFVWCIHRLNSRALEESDMLEL